jgi:hypothetical protein
VAHRARAAARRCPPLRRAATCCTRPRALLGWTLRHAAGPKRAPPGPPPAARCSLARAARCPVLLPTAYCPLPDPARVRENGSGWQHGAARRGMADDTGWPQWCPGNQTLGIGRHQYVGPKLSSTARKECPNCRVVPAPRLLPPPPPPSPSPDVSACVVAGRFMTCTQRSWRCSSTKLRRGATGSRRNARAARRK